jgi:hypothetical protein
LAAQRGNTTEDHANQLLGLHQQLERQDSRLLELTETNRSLMSVNEVLVARLRQKERHLAALFKRLTETEARIPKTEERSKGRSVLPFATRLITSPQARRIARWLAGPPGSYRELLARKVETRIRRLG